MSQWLAQTGVCPDSEHAAVMGMVGAHGTAATLPSATGACAETMSRFMGWGFALDDDWDRAGDSESGLHALVDRASRLVEVVEHPGASTSRDDRFVRAWADVTSDLHRRAFPSQIRRLIDGFRAYMLGTIQEASLQRRAELPEPAAYLPLRYASGASGCEASMVEISVGREVPCAEIESPVGRAVTETALIIPLLDNELFSLHKEATREEYDCGLIRVLRQQHPHYSQQEAVQAAIAVRDSIMGVFLALRRNLMATAGPEMRAYVEGLGHWVAGVLAYGPTSPRYITDTSASGGTTAPTPSPLAKEAQIDLFPQIARWRSLADVASPSN